MTTDLRRFTEAYATMTVAAYEPLILNWISLLGIHFAANEIASRYPKAKALKFDGKSLAAMALSSTMRRRLPRKIDYHFKNGDLPLPIDLHGQVIAPEAAVKLDVPGYPNAVAVGKSVYLNGILNADLAELSPALTGALTEAEAVAPAPLVAEDVAPHTAEGGAAPAVAPTTHSPLRLRRLAHAAAPRAVRQIPVSIAARMGVRRPGFNFHETRDTLQANMIQAAMAWVADPVNLDLAELMVASTNLAGVFLPVLWPMALCLPELLSPIGIAHFYRQLYFNKEEGVGPIEEAFTIAPLETLEVIYQTVRKQTHEEILEQGLEVVSEAAVEEKNLDEVSDKVSSMVQNDVSASMSANASGGIGVWQVGASATANFAVSSQRSREYSTRRLKEVTKRASERITKSFTIKTRDVTEVTETTTTRRVIRNDHARPVSYGLRRVLRRVNVKVQDLGPRLVWQLYLRNPGAGLARSRFVHFRESGPVAVPDIPPGVPPRPTGGIETESASTSLKWDGDRELYFLTIVVMPGADRDVTGLRIESLTDLEGGGKDDEAPAPHNEYDLGSSWDPVARTYTANIAILPGDSLTIQVTYSYTWEPSAAVMAAWEAQRAAAVALITEQALTEQFERDKTLITEKSKIKSRPANDLRREERYEVMNRMISYLFGRGDDPSEPTPLEIEYFYRFFDVDGIFTYNHPAWWKPRFSANNIGLERAAYEITAESDPAPLGSSLGWLIQLDGDRRRNEFINSPWVRICVPIRPGREREAIGWLSRYIEGEIGYNPNIGPIANLIAEVEAYRAREAGLGLDGPDYVTVASSPGAPANPATPEGVYPIVDEFDVTLPTEGFVYDELNVVIP